MKSKIDKTIPDSWAKPLDQYEINVTSFIHNMLRILKIATHPIAKITRASIFFAACHIIYLYYLYHLYYL